MQVLEMPMQFKQGRGSESWNITYRNKNVFEIPAFEERLVFVVTQEILIVEEEVA
jgi:hypothetical protein